MRRATDRAPGHRRPTPASLPGGLASLLLFLCLLVPASSARAQVVGPVPEQADGAEIVEHLDARLPLDLEFVDELGKPVRLGDYFASGERPVLLTLNYYSCPMLCTLQLNGLVAGLRDLDWSAGDQFEIVTVSIDHREEPGLAFQKKKTYVTDYGRESAASGWHFLVGREENIVRLARTVGFSYEYDEKTGEYAHPAVAWIITPDGRISRYLYGVQFEAQTLRYSVLEASEGRVGNAFDRFLMLCFHYDEKRGRYAPAAMRIMRMGAALTAVILAVWLSIQWRRNRKEPHRGGPGPIDPGTRPSGSANDVLGVQHG